LYVTYVIMSPLYQVCLLVRSYWEYVIPSPLYSLLVSLYENMLFRPHLYLYINGDDGVAFFSEPSQYIVHFMSL
jgi:hypothetical protein